jgi:hypothetical protein
MNKHLRTIRGTGTWAEISADAVQSEGQECGGNFSLTSEKVDMPQGGVRMIPVFSLTKNRVLECTIGSVPLCTSGRLRVQLCVRAFGFTHKDTKNRVFIWFFAH